MKKTLPQRALYPMFRPIRMKLAQGGFLDPVGGTVQHEKCPQPVGWCHPPQGRNLIVIGFHKRGSFYQKYATKANPS